MGNNTFYLTTPIYYVNDKPHIGHAYTTILGGLFDLLTVFVGAGQEMRGFPQQAMAS